MIVRVVNKKAADLPYLLRLILKHIYEPENMSLSEEELMQRSMVNWANKYDIKDVEHELICSLAKLIQDNQLGKFERRKSMFKEYGIDYKKFHRLPEAYDFSKENLTRIQKINEQAKKDTEWRN